MIIDFFNLPKEQLKLDRHQYESNVVKAMLSNSTFKCHPQQRTKSTTNNKWVRLYREDFQSKDNSMQLFAIYNVYNWNDQKRLITQTPISSFF